MPLQPFLRPNSYLFPFRAVAQPPEEEPETEANPWGDWFRHLFRKKPPPPPEEMTPTPPQPSMQDAESIIARGEDVEGLAPAPTQPPGQTRPQASQAYPGFNIAGEVWPPRPPGAAPIPRPWNGAARTQPPSQVAPLIPQKPDKDDLPEGYDDWELDYVGNRWRWKPVKAPKPTGKGLTKYRETRWIKAPNNIVQAEPYEAVFYLDRETNTIVEDPVATDRNRTNAEQEVRYRLDELRKQEAKAGKEATAAEKAKAAADAKKVVPIGLDTLEDLRAKGLLDPFDPRYANKPGYVWDDNGYLVIIKDSEGNYTGTTRVAGWKPAPFKEPKAPNWQPFPQLPGAKGMTFYDENTGQTKTIPFPKEYQDFISNQELAKQNAQRLILSRQEEAERESRRTGLPYLPGTTGTILDPNYEAARAARAARAEQSAYDQRYAGAQGALRNVEYPGPQQKVPFSAIPGGRASVRDEMIRRGYGDLLPQETEAEKYARYSGETYNPYDMPTIFGGGTLKEAGRVGEERQLMRQGLIPNTTGTPFPKALSPEKEREVEEFNKIVARTQRPTRQLLRTAGTNWTGQEGPWL